MEAVRRTINSNKLFTIFNLPLSLKDKEVEVFIIPVKSKNKKNIKKTVDSLVGIIPNEGLSLSEYRDERLKKYEVID